ncbi:MAG: HAD-IA family hydrolase [Anaerolineae bacterium]|nr:HAD-IA family hydrolase [Anaerolineae bacterium]
MRIKAIIFDFDGLILDTELAEFKTWEWIYKTYQVKFPLQEWLSTIGISESSFDIYKHLEKELHNNISREEVIQKRDLHLHELLSLQPVMPGVKELVLEARQAGVKLAVASGASYNWVSSNLKRLGIFDYFNGVHTREEVPLGKPDPGVYLSALKNLQVDANEAVAFEDSPNGIKAARSAGLFCIAVPNTLTKMLDTSQANHSLSSIADVNLEKLNDLFIRQTADII